MADTTITTIPALITETAASPANSVLTIDAPLFLENEDQEIILLIEVTQGTIRFAVGKAAAAPDNPAFAAGSTLTQRVTNKVKLNFFAAAQNDAFQVTAL